MKKRWMILLAGVLFTACMPNPESCPPREYIPVTTIDALPENAPVQFPLENYRVTGDYHMMGIDKLRRHDYHGAEDIAKDAGTPVYAMADGIITFSGPQGGYGWLIVIDHPQLHVYSLYGHLSPSHWAREKGPVKKGDLLGELGHGYENGYNKGGTVYMDPHLHFMIRVGERRDYPENSERRWMAGWMRACPSDLGWLQPSKFITEYAEQGESYLEGIAELEAQHTGGVDLFVYPLVAAGIMLGWHQFAWKGIMRNVSEKGTTIKGRNPWKVSKAYKALIEKADRWHIQYVLSAILAYLAVAATVLILINF